MLFWKEWTLSKLPFSLNESDQGIEARVKLQQKRSDEVAMLDRLAHRRQKSCGYAKAGVVESSSETGGREKRDCRRWSKSVNRVC